MLKIYFTENENVYVKLEKYLSGLLPSPARILRNGNGKPYLEGDPLFFSISHSANKALIAICDKPVGADMEILADRNYKAVLSRFCADERKEIKNSHDFLKHWVVREAYIKMLGDTVWGKLKKLSFTDGMLFYCGKPVDCEFKNGRKDNVVYSICITK